MKRPVIGLNMDFAPRATPEGDRSEFTLIHHYANAIFEAGGLPMLIPCLAHHTALGAYLERLDGFLLTGGEDYPPAWYGEEAQPSVKLAHPQRTAFDRALADAVLSTPLPVLGICGGMQLMGIALCGRLIQHLPTASAHTGEQMHSVTLEPGSRLAALFKKTSLSVNSCHHQGLHPDFIGEHVHVAARAGDGVIEAVEGKEADRFLLGVQWHPERLDDPQHRQLLFGALIDAALAARARR